MLSRSRGAEVVHLLEGLDRRDQRALLVISKLCLQVLDAHRLFHVRIIAVLEVVG